MRIISHLDADELYNFLHKIKMLSQPIVMPSPVATPRAHAPEGWNAARHRSIQTRATRYGNSWPSTAISSQSGGEQKSRPDQSSRRHAVLPAWQALPIPSAYLLQISERALPCKSRGLNIRSFRVRARLAMSETPVPITSKSTAHKTLDAPACTRINIYALRHTCRSLKLILIRSPSEPVLPETFGSTSCVSHAGNRITQPSTGSKYTSDQTSGLRGRSAT